MSVSHPVTHGLSASKLFLLFLMNLGPHPPLMAAGNELMMVYIEKENIGHPSLSNPLKEPASSDHIQESSVLQTSLLYQEFISSS